MDLNLDVLYKEGDALVVALSHYYKHPSGDMCADLDMQIRLFPELKMAEALTFQQAIPPLYQEVYPEPGKGFPYKSCQK